jgi:hypothetical protein
MAETLQEFLVNIKYNVDAGSQENFLSMLKRVATSVGGVSAEIAGLAVAVIGLTKSLAEVGDKMFFMSARLGSSVSDIQAASYAMSQFGLSSEEAVGSLERFGSFTRSYGPAATSWLRSMGVTATDSATRLEQFGQRLAAMGGTAEKQGTIEYANALRTAQMGGLDERGMLAVTAPGYAQERKEAGIIQQRIWGTGTPEELKQRQTEWTTKANEVMGQFGKLGLIFDTMKQKFGLSLFDRVLPELVKLNEWLLKNQDQFRQWGDMVAGALGSVVRLVGVAIDTWTRLPQVVKIAIESFIMIPKILGLAQSPVARLIAAITGLLLLVDDYNHWKEDQKDGESTSLFDWSMFDKFAKDVAEFLQPVIRVTNAFDDWLCKVTGIHGLFGAIAGILAGFLLWKAPAWFMRVIGLAVPAAGNLIAQGMMAAAGAIGLSGALIGAGVLAGLGATGLYATEADDVDAAKLGFTRSMVDPDKWIHTESGKVLTDREMKALLLSTSGGTVVPGYNAVPFLPQPGREARAGGNQFAGDYGAPSVGYTGERIRPAGSTGWAAAAVLAGSGRGGGEYTVGRGGDPDAGNPGDVSDIGLTAAQFDVFRNTLGMRESSGRYNLMGGSSNRFAGKYQFGAAEIAETAKALGERTPTQAEFLADPAMQERFFRQYTLNHHNQLMRDPNYRGQSPEEKAGTLATAHLLGVGGALKQLHGGNAGADAFGTSGSSYAHMITRALKTAPLGTEGGGRGGAGVAGLSRGDVTISNSTVVHVSPGPDAHSTALAVADQQNRINENHVRLSEGKIL